MPSQQSNKQTSTNPCKLSPTKIALPFPPPNSSSLSESSAIPKSKTTHKTARKQSDDSLFRPYLPMHDQVTLKKNPPITPNGNELIYGKLYLNFIREVMENEAKSLITDYYSETVEYFEKTLKKGTFDYKKFRNWIGSMVRKITKYQEERKGVQGSCSVSLTEGNTSSVEKETPSSNIEKRIYSSSTLSGRLSKRGIIKKDRKEITTTSPSPITIKWGLYSFYKNSFTKTQ